MPERNLFCLHLVHHAFLVLAYATTPLIGGILVAGLAIAMFQGAFQIEDGSMQLGAKLVVAFLLLASSGSVIYFAILHLAHSWIAHAPAMINRSWS